MRVYHMSDTLKLGDTLIPDHKHTTALAQPFVQALEQSVDCYYAMVLNGKYLRAVLGKFRLWEWSDYIKWSVEGAFEYIRKTEFPHICSRIHSNYFYDNLPNCKVLFDYDWGSASEEERNSIHLYEIDLEDNAPVCLDMRVYDEAYTAMEEREDVQTVLDCARRYFRGEATANPVWELMSNKPAKAVRDITAFLRGEAIE